MEQPESQYQSYLLRLWRSGEAKTWQVMLEHVGTHERRGFADLDGLCTFLREQTAVDHPQLAQSRSRHQIAGLTSVAPVD